MAKRKKQIVVIGGLDPDTDDEATPDNMPCSANVSTQSAEFKPAEHQLNKKKQKRAQFSGFSGGLDPDSDDEVDFEMTLTSNGSRKPFVTYKAFAADKETRPEDVPLDLPSRQPDPPSEAPTPPEPGKRNQGASVMMQAFYEHFDELQSAIISMDHHEGLGRECSCGANSALHRCLECFQAHLLCQSCILAVHTHIPFHHIQEWTGTHFKRTSLSALGATIPLGHRGQACPNRLPTLGRKTVVVHTNGIHHVHIQYCACPGSLGDALQLTRSQLFPATIDQPATAFTFDVLRDFHVQSLASKKAAMDHFMALRNHTNKAFPQKTPDRYREFIRVIRVWRHLTSVRRTGQYHGIDTFVPHRRPGSLTVRCPACPEVGFNVDKEVIDNAAEDEAHKYTKFVSPDGNYKLQRKNKCDDPDDVALNQGNAYFVDTKLYKQYLESVGIEYEKSTCHNLRAVRLQNVMKFKNASVSGVVGVQCARHGFNEPQGLVDLTKGEAFAITDYALAYALSESADLRWIMISYDIWCQYSINLQKRFKVSFPRMAPIIARVRGAIPSGHIRGHQLECQLIHAFKYIPYSGETYGEMIETSWAEQNQTGGSTKEMNHGHRHDTLDDFHGYWNWTKLHKLSTTLLRLYTVCANRVKSLDTVFEALCNRHGAQLVAQWEAMDVAPKKVDGVWQSVYEAKITDGPPTQGKAYQKLIQGEMVAELSGKGLTGDAHFVNTGLRVEQKQRQVAMLVKAKSPSLAEERVRLRRELSRWRKIQFQRFPLLHAELKEIDTLSPETEELLLPSSFNSPSRERFGLTELASVEYSLREGQAHDALHAVRLAIQTFNYNVRFKIDNVRGQSANMRANEFLSSLAADKVTAADKYRQARCALIKLGLAEDDLILQPLFNNQLWSRNESSGPRMGETKSKKEEPWFWLVGRPAGMTEVEEVAWSLEMDRVKWFRQRAARDRAREEKDILDEEFSRTIRSFKNMSEIWKNLASGTVQDPGAASYAWKQSVMYTGLANDCEIAYKKAKSSPPIANPA